MLATAPEQIRRAGGSHAFSTEAEPASNIALSHALFTVLAATEDRRPGLVALDDLHWCDAASLEFVLYLVHRLEELPLVVVMTRRLAHGDASSDILDRIATQPRDARSHAVRARVTRRWAELAREVLGERAEGSVVAACQQATSGNPFYVHELLLALRDERHLGTDELAEHARALAPPVVGRILRVRVGRVGDDGAALARAVAVLGDDAPLRPRRRARAARRCRCGAARPTPSPQSRSCLRGSRSDSSTRSSAIRSPTTSRRRARHPAPRGGAGCCTARARNPNVSPLTCLSRTAGEGIRGPSSSSAAARDARTLAAPSLRRPVPVPRASRNRRRRRSGRTCSPNSGSPRRPPAVRALPSTSSRRLRCVRIRADERSWRCTVGTRSTRTAYHREAAAAYMAGLGDLPDELATAADHETPRRAPDRLRGDRLAAARAPRALGGALAPSCSPGRTADRARAQRQLLAQAAVHAAFAASRPRSRSVRRARVGTTATLIAHDGSPTGRRGAS